MSLSIFQHLLPRARAWTINKVGKQLRQLFEGLVEPVIEDTREYFDLIWYDLFPSTTREIPTWEAVYGITDTGQTEQERRDRLDALWKAQGGQDPQYIQDTMQAAGFDVYVHEWWELPATSPPVARNPYLALGTNTYGCGDPLMECGEEIAQCGNHFVSNGYMLVNKIYTSQIDYICLCGEAGMECGEARAQCGENNGYIFVRKQYPIPPDPNDWPYILYIGGQTFPDEAAVPAERIDEFEDLLLKICPMQQWIALLIDVQSVVIEKSTGNTVIVKSTGDTVVIEV